MNTLLSYGIWYALTRCLGVLWMRQIKDSRKRQEMAQIVIVSILPVAVEIMLVALLLMGVFGMLLDACIEGFSILSKKLAGDQDV